MTEPLRFRRRRRTTTDRPCRACERPIAPPATVYEFSAGPGCYVVFHPTCAPTTLPGVLICPDCLGGMRTPPAWDSLRHKHRVGQPYCPRCQAGAA